MAVPQTHVRRVWSLLIVRHFFVWMFLCGDFKKFKYKLLFSALLKSRPIKTASASRFWTDSMLLKLTSNVSRSILTVNIKRMDNPNKYWLLWREQGIRWLCSKNPTPNFAYFRYFAKSRKILKWQTCVINFSPIPWRVLPATLLK